MIPGRGHLLTPGLADKLRFGKIGGRIQLMFPDKTEVFTSIKGIAFEGSHDILIPFELTIQEIPIGTQVFTVDDCQEGRP